MNARLVLKLTAISLCQYGLAGCVDDTQISNRKQGDSISGSWYDANRVDACAYDTIVMNFNGNLVSAHKFTYSTPLYEFEQLKSDALDELQLKMTPKSDGSSSNSSIIKFLDEGTKLTPVAVTTSEGQPLPAKATESLQKNLTLTHCTQPSWFGALKLTVGWYSKYDPSVERKLMTSDGIKNEVTRQKP